jgi:hypothetical protein
MGYDNNQLFVNVQLIDHNLWYNGNPASDVLTNWDSVTLYLDKTGAIGTTLANAYRFDGQLNGDEETRAAWQAAYTGTLSSWITATTPFTTFTGYSGGFNNNDPNTLGWIIYFRIPYASLGLSGPPAAGTVWGLAVAVHDRDGAPHAAMQPDEPWPEGANPAIPSTWGQLYFGTPVYTPQSASPSGTVTIRNGLNGAVVREASAGGHTVCGYPLTDMWNVWGNRVVTTFYSTFEGGYYDPNYVFNVQNLSYISEWPCFSKYYTIFPLSAVPPGKVVISATLALNQFGNAGQGWDPGPVRSFIQVLTVGQELTGTLATLTWNNAPLARENVAMAPVDPLAEGAPAVWRTWDVSRAVAEAYSVGQPLRLVIYSADDAFHSGRYFRPSSWADAWERPTLTVRWGDPQATIHKTVRPLYPENRQPLTYALNFVGSGSALTLTDSLPPEVGDPGPIQVEGGGAASCVSHQITWTGSPSAGQPVTLTFSVTPEPGPVLIRNTAVLTDAQGHVSTDTATAIADPVRVRLSLIRR